MRAMITGDAHPVSYRGETIRAAEITAQQISDSAPITHYYAQRETDFQSNHYLPGLIVDEAIHYYRSGQVDRASLKLAMTSGLEAALAAERWQGGLCRFLRIYTNIDGAAIVDALELCRGILGERSADRRTASWPLQPLYDARAIGAPGRDYGSECSWRFAYPQCGYALSVTAGMLSSNPAGVDADKLIDGDFATTAWTFDPDDFEDLHCDFGSGNDQEVVGMTVRGPATDCFDYAHGWYSDNDSDWTLAGSASIGSTGVTTITWSSVGSHRYWKLTLGVRVFRPYCYGVANIYEWQFLGFTECDKSYTDCTARGQTHRFNGILTMTQALKQTYPPVATWNPPDPYDWQKRFEVQ